MQARVLAEPIIGTRIAQGNNIFLFRSEPFDQNMLEYCRGYVHSISGRIGPDSDWTVLI